MFSIFFAAAAALSSPTPSALPPGDARGFGDWHVGCDNVRHCEAISLVPQFGGASRENHVGASLTIRANPDPDGTVQIGIRDADLDYRGDTVVLVINGVPGPVATRSPGDELFHFEEQTIALAREIAQARSLSLLDDDAHPLGAISAQGSAAALRYIDEHQQRANTSAAFVAIGERVYRPARLERPQIQNIVPEEGAVADGLTEAQVIALADQHDCYRRDEDSIRRNGTHALGRGATLILIACGDGAYNFNDLAFIRRNGELEPARFDYTFSWGEETVPPMLVNTYWNDERGILSTYAKGRGIGDCGTSESYVWDGEMFRMTERREMNGCYGSLYWIPVYQAVAIPAGQ